MPQVAEEIRRMTIAQFDDFVAGVADDTEYELIDGELAMMVNPTETHESVLTSPQETLALDAIAFSIGLGQIYFDLPF
jgi:hypothetical protein